ncbi:MAG: 6-pyruvoyl-tetrahydropterin synthase-related protein [Acidimicrobiales bacterium]
MVDELIARAQRADDPDEADESGRPEGPDDTADTAGGIARPPVPWHVRAGRRVVRRPMAWVDRPWPTDRIIRFVVTALCLGGTTWAALQTVHPDLVFTNNTPTGGDMGAHVMGPAFLRDVLLPHFQLSGWSNYWYAGFPMYRFYMVVPALAIVLLNVVLPYGIAFKVIAVSGIVTLPACCWAFGRLARFRYPMPELFAIGGLLFLFDESYSIYGGNVKSTMAGEFSFSIALSLGVLGLGLLARGLETGKHRSWAAIVLALAFLSHGIVLIFVALGALLLVLVWADRQRLVYGIGVGLTAVLLAAFWVVPFLFNHAYMTDMKYGYRPSGAADSFWDMFFPLTTFFDIFITSFAILGFVACIARRHLNGAWMGITTLALVAGVYVTRDSLPVIGLLWNPRLLPFVYILRYLLMMVGIVEFALICTQAAMAVRRVPEDTWLKVGTSVAAVVGVSVLCIELMFFRVMPGAGFTTHNGEQVYSWGPISLTATSTDALSDAWSRYNFTGYEDKPAYGEYKGLVDTMASLGEDPANGCGRALWENNSENGKYGTTMALMLLPHWTDGCIASMEGLFFEASGTTPYHFITAAAMSESSSNPVRQLRYDNNDAAKGVKYLQALGVKYVMVFTDQAKQQADAQPELTKVRTSGPWNIYSVANSDLVVPLSVQPVVVAKRDGDPRERNLELGMSWFQHQDEWSALPADDGPADWQRIEVAPDLAQRQDDRVDIVKPVDAIDPVPLPAVTVSDVDLGDQDLSFHVDQVGVPVLVRISYFPNWKVEGAEGPYRVAPNLMVVVPTSNDVHLSFERSGLDILAYVLTFLGIGLSVFWRVRGDVVFAADRPRSAWKVTGGWFGRDDDDLDLDLDDDLPGDGRTPATTSTTSTDHAYARWRPGNADPTVPLSEPDLEVELSQPVQPPPAQPPQVAGDDPDRL